MTINKRIVGSALTIGTAGALLVGATFAFFSDTAQSTGNTFATGTLDIDLVDQNTNDPFQAEALVTNWQPGEEKLVNFDVRNIGSLPVHLRGFATGTWGNPALDVQDMVRVVKVEKFDGGWVEIDSNPAGITGIFYYSDDGTCCGTLTSVAPSTRAQLRLTVLLDEDAGNDFQSETFTSSLTVEAKQTNDNTSWP